MKLDKVTTIKQMQCFLDGSQCIAFRVASSKQERYELTSKLLRRFSYARLKRKDKGTVIKFLMKVTAYSRQQLTRMIKVYMETGQLKPRQVTSKGFQCIYTQDDIKRLAKLDKLHDCPNGARIKKLCERAYEVFHDADYERLSTISVAHIYNLRQSSQYKKYHTHFEKTKGVKSSHIGQRRKPHNQGKPGYIRIDTVHQGDFEGSKGVYHINAVDEVTQFEVVISVEKISEQYLLPALEKLLDTFPFRIINFHSDNGSEYVNKTVAKLLGKLLIEFTKSRPRHSNDNALAEGKNASIVRKMFGYTHIPQTFAKRINEFNDNYLIPYINYHRPCYFPKTIIDKKGKEKKKYLYKDMMTPYEKFKSLTDASSYLKDGVTFEKLDEIASSISDNEAAALLQKQRNSLFKDIDEGCTKIA